MKYLTVGTKNIREEEFRKIEDTDFKNSMKPVGGMWFTEFDNHLKNYNNFHSLLQNKIYMSHFFFFLLEDW